MDARERVCMVRKSSRGGAEREEVEGGGGFWYDGGMKENFSVVVPEELAGLRADAALLALCPFSSRRAVAKAFGDRAVAWDGTGAVCAKGERVRAGATLRVARLYEQVDLRVVPEPDAPLEVVYEDAWLVGVCKRAGQDCHPLDFGERGTLAGALVARYPEMAGIGDDPLAPALLHRIDGGTSGLVLAARTREAYAAVRAQFEGQTVAKEYLAIVEGRVAKPGAVSGFLAHSYRGGEMRMVAAAPGHHGARALKAETFYRPLRPEGSGTLLSVTIRTGVTHQIRSQLASIGHPVAGDMLYGAAPDPAWRAGTHALHSWKAALVHPGTGRRVEIVAPWVALRGGV